MRRVLVVLGCALALSACEVTETLHIGEDGTGTYSVEWIVDPDDPGFLGIDIVGAFEDVDLDAFDRADGREFVVEVLALRGNEPFLGEIVDSFDIRRDDGRLVFDFTISLATYLTQAVDEGTVFADLTLENDGDDWRLRADSRSSVEHFLQELFALESSPFENVDTTSPDFFPMTFRARVQVEGDITSSDSHLVEDGIHVWEWSLGREARPGIDLRWSTADGWARPRVIALAALILAAIGAIVAILVLGFGVPRRSPAP